LILWTVLGVGFAPLADKLLSASQGGGSTSDRDLAAAN
jgi:hypothetical protein